VDYWQAIENQRVIAMGPSPERELGGWSANMDYPQRILRDEQLQPLHQEGYKHHLIG